MSMNSKQWTEVGKTVANNVVQKSSVEGAICVAATTAIASGQTEAMIVGVVVQGFWWLWKTFFNHNQ